MLEYLIFVVTLFIYSWSRVQGFEPSLIMNSIFEKASTDGQIYGNVTESTGVMTLIECSVHCITAPDCKGVMYGYQADDPGKCFVVKSGIYFINMTDYEYYNIKKCADPDLANYDFLINVGLPCPRLYFPLNVHTGTKLGSVPENAQFVSDGKVGGAFLNNITTSDRSFYNLGFYPESEYCFPLAESCPLGVTVAFWVKIMGDLSGRRQGIITTRTGVFIPIIHILLSQKKQLTPLYIII